MKYHSPVNTRSRSGLLIRGFTLIEAVLYTALLSTVLAVILPYVYSINVSNLTLVHAVS